MQAVDAVGLPYLTLAARGSGITILLYHGVSAEQGAGIFNYRKKFISPTAFAQQLSWLKKHFLVVTLQEALDMHAQGEHPARSVVAITFDDGYFNNYAEAFPLLRDAGVPATFFLTTDFVDKRIPLPVDSIEHSIGLTTKQEFTFTLNNTQRIFKLSSYSDRIAADMVLRSHAKRLGQQALQDLLRTVATQTEIDLAHTLENTPYKALTWAHVTEMESHGMTFAPHTCSHTILSTLSNAEASADIAQSTACVYAHTNTHLPIFAYPNGGTKDFTHDTQEILKEQGFRYALTTSPGRVAVSDNPFAIPRYTLDGTNQMYRFRLAISGIRDTVSRFIH